MLVGQSAITSASRSCGTSGSGSRVHCGTGITPNGIGRDLSRKACNRRPTAVTVPVNKPAAAYLLRIDKLEWLRFRFKFARVHREWRQIAANLSAAKNDEPSPWNFLNQPFTLWLLSALVLSLCTTVHRAQQRNGRIYLDQQLISRK
jgi:hypothetical protein